MTRLDDLDAELRNWARWSHSGDDSHKLECSISSIWRFWLPHKHRDEGWGDATPGERIEDPINEIEAEQTDRKLKRIAAQHWQVIRLHYYRHKPQAEVRLGQALRAYGDLG